MANQSKGPKEMINVDCVSLIPSVSPASAKKRNTTATKQKKPKPTPMILSRRNDQRRFVSPAPAKKRNTTATKQKKPKPTPNPSLPYDFVSLTPSISPPPAKKRKTNATTKTLMSLPYELLLNCLARVSRLYYPTLSLVSKSFRSILASSELYKVRSLLGHIESCLYVCLERYAKSFWFTLCRKPGKKKGYVLARVRIPNSPPADFEELVAVGSSIYHISPLLKPASVSVLDCRSHTWCEAPNMRVRLNSFTTSVLDGKIYVAGIRKDGHSDSPKNWIEVFDTKTQIWDPEPIPCSETYDGVYYRSACIGGKIHVVHLPDDVVAYNSKEGRWDMVERGRLCDSLCSNSYCEIDNVLYSVVHEEIGWYDMEASKWRSLKGLVGLPEFPPDTCFRLANYGGKMAVFWSNTSPKYIYTCTRMKIWCAEIALERRQNCEIWGQVEWFDHVRTFDACDVSKVLAVTL